MNAKTRKTVYTIVSAVLVMLVVLGVVQEPAELDAVTEQIVDSVDQIIAVAVILLARANVNPDSSLPRG